MRTSYLDLFRWDEEARGLEGEAARELLARQRLDLWGLLDEPAYAGCLASMNPDVFHQLDQTGLAGTGLWGYFAEGDRDLRVRVQDEPPDKERLVYASPAHLAHFEQWVLRRHALGSCTVRLAARLRALPGVLEDGRLMSWFGELTEMETELRTCGSLELGERLRETEARIADVTEYRSLDPAESLRRLIARCVADPECAPRLRLVPSG